MNTHPLEQIYRDAKSGALTYARYEGWEFSSIGIQEGETYVSVRPPRITHLPTYVFGIGTIESPTHLNSLIHGILRSRKS